MSGWYETAFRKVLFPTYEAVRGRLTPVHMANYQRDQWLTSEQIAALQWQRLKRLLEHCHSEVPFYRRQWKALGVTPEDIRNLDDYAQLPLLTKADIREHFNELKADSLRERLLYKATGGSTGEPLRFGYTRESNDRRTAVMWRGYEWAGARMGRRTLFLWGGSVGTQTHSHQLKERLYAAAFARRVLDSFQMSEANMAGFADAIDRYRAPIMVAYVGPLVRLSQWLLATGRTPFRPHAIIAAAEPLHEFQRDIIEQAFGCEVFNTYGCREFMLVAAECERRQGLHVNADHLVVELHQSDDTANHHAVADGPRSGEVVITDLFNYGMPFLRYANGDRASLGAPSCDCGRGLPLLSRVDGRVLDAIRTADGHCLPGEFFPHMLKDVAGVERFQVVQRQLDRLDLSIVRGKAFNDASLDYIRREVRKVLGDSIELNCIFVDDIPLTRSGKLRVTVSELPQ